MPKKSKSIVAVETNPLEHVDFHVSDGTLKQLKVFVGCAEDIGKLFVRCDLCGTFILLWARHSPKNLEIHRDKAMCKEQKKMKETELIQHQEQAKISLMSQERVLCWSLNVGANLKLLNSRTLNLFRG